MLQVWQFTLAQPIATKHGILSLSNKYYIWGYCVIPTFLKICKDDLSGLCYAYYAEPCDDAEVLYRL